MGLKVEAYRQNPEGDGMQHVCEIVDRQSGVTVRASVIRQPDDLAGATIDQRCLEIGRQAAELLRRYLAGEA